MKNESGRTLRLNFLPEINQMRNSLGFGVKNRKTDGLENLADDVDRRLALMVRMGLRPAEIAWALDVSIDEIEAHLKNLCRQLGGQDPAAKSVSEEEASNTAIQTIAIAPAEAQPAREPLLEQAVGVLGGRIVLVGQKIYLDGVSASFRDLVVAAAAQGVEIPYPGLRPLPAAFHTGPSELGDRRRKKSASSHLSIHVPY